MKTCRVHPLGPGAPPHRGLRRRPRATCRISLAAAFVLVWLTVGLERSYGAATEGEAVGGLGGGERLQFEGNRTFSGDSIVAVLAQTLEFHVLAHPGALLEDYLAWIESRVLRGYQRAGFVQARVAVTADRASERVLVRIVEGTRFRCGMIQVSGLDRGVADAWLERLRQAHDEPETSSTAGTSILSWPWTEGGRLWGDSRSLEAMAAQAELALRELDRHGAKVRCALELDAPAERAHLRLEVVEPGAAGRLETIEVSGLAANRREDLLEYLKLAPGQPLRGNLTNDVVRRLRDSARFLEERAELSPLPEPGQFRLHLEVVEYQEAPLLSQALTAEDQAALRLRQWILDWTQRADDWLLEVEAIVGTTRYRTEIVLGENGLALAIRGPDAPASPGLRYAMVRAPESLGLYSRRQRRTLMRPGPRRPIQAFLRLTGDPAAEAGQFGLTVGGRVGSAADGEPDSIQFDLAPVAFLGLVHSPSTVCRLEQGILSIRAEPEAGYGLDIEAEASSGRLRRLRAVSSDGDLVVTLRSERGAFSRVSAAVAQETAEFPNAWDARRPWSSAMAFLFKDLAELASVITGELERRSGMAAIADVSFEQSVRLIAALEDLPWDDLLAPFNRVWGDAQTRQAAEAFPLVIEPEADDSESGNDLLASLAGPLLWATDEVWSRGSWPWAVFRSVAFLAAGRTRHGAEELEVLLRSEEFGPLACLVAESVVWRFNPELAMRLGREGAARTSAAAFNRDLRGLLGGEAVGAEFMRNLLGNQQLLQSPALADVRGLLGTNDLAAVFRDGVAALAAHPGQPPDEALGDVVKQHWDNALRPRLLTTFATVCLTAGRATGAAPEKALALAAAGWLEEAADHGLGSAQALLGHLYRLGLGVERNPALAVRWLRKAAEQDHPHAACELGRLYQAGEGVPKDPDQAARWFRREAARGCTSAQVGLAQVLLSAVGPTDGDRREALDWLNRAAEKANAHAQLVLGTLAEQQGDTSEALRWFRLAAERGLADAQAVLGERLSDGISVTPDYAEAWVWFKRAAGQGHPTAGLEVRRLERKLTPEQLEGARRTLKPQDN